MFADIAGYTSMMQHDETLAMNKLHHFKEQLMLKVKLFHGEIIQYYGDGCLMIFTNAVDAVNCAKLLQEDFTKDPHVPVRIGIHLGDILLEEGNIFGDSVNISSRIQSMGVPGAVLLSDAIKNQIKNKSEFQLTSLGNIEFKNVDDPIEVFALSNIGFPIPDKANLSGKFKELIPPVVVADLAEEKKKLKRKKTFFILLGAIALLAAGYFIFENINTKGSTGTKETPKSIAVLYFDNMSGDPEQEYFSDGITEEIITHISKIKNIRVISRTSVLTYKGKPKNLKKIAEELHVSSILEGSVRKSGNTIRVTAQLIDAKNDQHIWAETYDRNVKDIFEVQSEIARMIAQKMKIEITPEANAKISQIPTQNVEAYDQFKKGMYYAYKKYFNSYKDEDFEKSKKYFERAIQLDSGFAEAYAGLAEIYDGLRNKYLFAGSIKEFPKELQVLKEKLARKALELKPNSSFVNTAMVWAMVHREEPNFDSSFYYLKKAFYLDPADPLTNMNLSVTLSEDLGLNATAIPFTLNAIKTDPLDPSFYSYLGKQNAMIGKYPEAKKALNTCLELSEGLNAGDYNLLFWLAYFGEYEKAANRIKEVAWSDPFPISFLYAAKGELGKVGQGQKDNIYIRLASNRGKVLKDVIKEIETEVDNGNNRGEYSYDFLSHSFYLDAYRNDPDFKRVLEKAKKNHDAKMLKYGNIEMPD